MNAEFLLDDQNVHLKKVWETQSNYKIEEINQGGADIAIYFFQVMDYTIRIV